MLPRLRFGEGSLLDALAREVRIETKGLVGEIPRDAWRLDAIPAHLRFNYRVLDEEGKELAQGRDLADLKRRFAAKAASKLPRATGDAYSRDNIRRWDFGEIPGAVQLDRAGIKITAYPTLVDLGQACGLRVADSPRRAAELGRAGLCRLFILTSSHEFGRLRRGLPDLERLRLMSASLGPFDALLDDILMLIADLTLFDRGYQEIRSEDAFDRAVAAAEPKLWNAGSQVRTIVGQIVEAWQVYSQRVAAATSPTFRAVVADEQDHAPRLIKTGFLRSTPREWLVHVPRYLTASRLRLERLPGGGVVRDERLLAELKPWWQLFTGNEQVLLEDGARRDEFVTFRWMLEELRVSLFAQDLKTAVPISYKRLAEQWDRVVKAR